MAKNLHNSKAHILVAENDPKRRNHITDKLRQHGYWVTQAKAPHAMARLLRGLVFDLLLLNCNVFKAFDPSDIHLLFLTSKTPIVTITSQSTPASRLACLEAGAEEYICEPFDDRELVLRLKRNLERLGKPDKENIGQVNFGPYKFCLNDRQLFQGANVIRLTQREQEIMHCLAKKRGKPVARPELSGLKSTIGERTIDVQVNKLRQKIEPDPSSPVWLKTVRGVGYSLDNE
ncbi:response regulator transcription factor [uncultured Roseibium sp.]|uniref:winged helix-turn-helix domain-containing protein n=1 Tax=uncultured Roseibium sp. TaxID=1936171 RepID=UPI002629B5A1|nr:response regulator transcription factor [uncultured Roseibium sp.]